MKIVASVAIASALVAADRIDEVVLVGGQTRMPRIQALVKDLFANRHVYQPQPDRIWSPGGPHPDEMTHKERMAEVCQILGFGLVRLHQKNAAVSKAKAP